MAGKPWRDKSFLHDRYTIKKQTIYQIADECEKMGFKVTPMTIYNNLKEFGLVKNARTLGPRRTGGNNSKKKGYYG